MVLDWTGYVGDVQFHSSCSVAGSADIFFACLDNRRIIPFRHLHHPKSQDLGRDGDFTDEEWAQISIDPSQYLVLVARTVFLTVDAETKRKEEDATDDDDARTYPYSVRQNQWRFGQIYLRPSWRGKQPAELEFVRIATTRLGDSLMLIERRGPVAYRVQMVDEPTLWLDTHGWRLQSIILG
jgi:hypothetical protein